VIYAILTGSGPYWEIDQFVEGPDGQAIVRREVADLKAMGCETKVRTFADWEAAHSFETKIRGY
jgi:hypothetical protein